MQGISSRNGVPQTVAKSPAAAPTSDTDPTTSTPDDSQTQTADTPAATPHLSRAGRFLGFLQHLEDKHPEEAKKVLSGIADHLRKDAERAGPFADRLKTLADKFDKAAESGDLSGLVPKRPSFGHHAMRAYHDASGAASGDAAAAALSAATGITPAASSTPAAAPASEPVAASNGGASATGNKPDGGASTESATTKPTDVTA
jgi:hypothetical protein